MTSLDDLFDPADLQQAVDAGHVRVQTHPTLPLLIHNYSEACQFARAWTPVTRQCRGLITHTNGEVMARCLPKFFNVDEPDAHVGAHDDTVIVTDKMDGSLGILYPTGDGYAIATRGSFASEQALHATAVWRERYAATVVPLPGWTYLFEIIYPGNRIVVDYGDTDDLVLLGAVHIRTGTSMPPSVVPRWRGPRAQTFPYRTLADALAAPVRPGREGLVVHYIDPDKRVKIKQEEYVRLHRIVTGMNERVVWEHLGEGKPLDELLAPLPEEFHGWVRNVADRLTRERDMTVAVARMEHSGILSVLPDGWTRRDYAEIAKLSDRAPWLFLLLDGKDPSPKVWRTLRPSGAITMTAGEEAA